MLYCRIVNGKCEKSECRPEFELSCELLVAGLGTAGAMAAIAGAGSGLDTIGVEVLGAAGGLGTVGGIWDYSWGNPGGIFEKIDLRAQKLCDSFFAHTGEEKSEIGSRFIHGAAKAYVLEDEAVKAGCRLLFDTSVTGVFVEDDMIVGVECHNGSGRVNIAAKVIIDSTGDQIVVRSAGLPTRTERDAARMKFTRTRAAISGKLVRNLPVACGNRTSELQDDYRLSGMLIETGARPPFLREKYSEEGRTVIVAEMPGYRDAERIYGRETLDLIPYLRGELPGEPLFYGFSPIDHVGGDLMSVSFGQKLWWIGCRMRGFGISVPVTAGMMTPRGISNLIVADKGISVGDELCGCLRMKKDMERLGEAAAKLAFFAIKENIPVTEVESSKVREALRADGVYYERDSVISLLDGFMDRTPEKIPETREELEKLTFSDRFGAAAVFALGGKPENPEDEFGAMLDIPKTRENAAIILGILGMFGRKIPGRVYDILREIASKPVTDEKSEPDKLPQSAAIWILGELRDVESAELLKKLRSGFEPRESEPTYEFLARLCDAAVRRIEEI